MKRKYYLIAAVAVVMVILITVCALVQVNKRITVDIQAPDTFEQGQLIILSTVSNASDLTWKILPETSNFRIISGGRQAIFSGDGSVATYTIFVAGCKNHKIESVLHTLSLGKEESKKDKLNPFQIKLISWIPSNATREERVKLAQSFRSIATLITNEKLESLDDIIKSTTWSNREALGDSLIKWESFFSELKKELETNPPENHSMKWREIALALDNK